MEGLLAFVSATFWGPRRHFWGMGFAAVDFAGVDFDGVDVVAVDFGYCLYPFIVVQGRQGPHMSYGQYYRVAKRTWILYKDLSGAIM